MESPTSKSNTQKTQFQPSDRVKFNVGGRLFETSISTVQSAGPDSLLAASNPSRAIFIDRDPDIFSAFLSLLRTNRLPLSTARRFSREELLLEAAFYNGLESSLLLSALTPPPLSGFDASPVAALAPASDPVVSTFSAAEDGSVWIAHAGQVSAYGPLLSHSSTIRTHLDLISSICRLSPEVAAVGSQSAAGVHFYNVSGGSGGHLGSTQWTDPSDPRTHKSRVVALGSASATDSFFFASFECRHGENSVLLVDRSTLKIVSELTRQSGNSSKYASAKKMRWVPELGILVGSSVSAGAFGCSGYIRLWDPRSRSGSVVWETSEPGSGRSTRFGDAFADVDVDLDTSTLVKVCSLSGDLGLADMRRLGDDPWVYVKDPNPVAKSSAGSGYVSSVMHCYKKQVFVGKDTGLEVWASVCGERSAVDGGGKKQEYDFRRTFMDKYTEDRGFISMIEGGGNRLFVCREDMEGIEVWESSNLSGLQSVTTM